MNEIIETIQRDNNTRIEIYADDDSESPRKGDNLGTMTCFHRRYMLGDKHTYKHLGNCLLELARDGLTEENFDFGHIHAYDNLPFPKWLDDQIWKYINAHYIILPLFIYDHSGITINTTGFSLQWDLGQVGYIYVSKVQIKKEYGWKHITSKRAKQISEYLKQEVKTYDQFLTNDVYGFHTMCNVCNDDIFSSWEFYGHNWQDNGLLESADVDCKNCKETKYNLQMTFDFVKGV